MSLHLVLAGCSLRARGYPLRAGSCPVHEGHSWGQGQTRPDNLPEIGQQIADNATRDGVAERLADPAGHKSVEVDWALITDDDQRLGDSELSMVQAATHHAANPRYLVHTVPGLGQILSLVRLYEIHDLARFPRGQDVVS